MAIRVSLTVHFMSCGFDRIVLPSLSDRHAFDWLAMFINYSYFPLRRGERADGKQPVSKHSEG